VVPIAVAGRPIHSVLEGILDLLAGLLQIALGLVGPTLNLQLLVIGGPAEPLFACPLNS